MHGENKKVDLRTKIDPELKRLAQDADINFAELIEDAIRKKLNILNPPPLKRRGIPLNL